jgi:hexosaminidase
MNHHTIIPHPASITWTGEDFELKKDTEILFLGDQTEVWWLVRRIAFKCIMDLRIPILYGYAWQVPESNKILLNLDPSNSELADEGYHLTVSRDGVHLEAKAKSGFYYGIKTLLELLPSKESGKAILPGLIIEDQPRFLWRGMHLDVARHYYSVDDISRFILLLGKYKFNRFHLHLTDDQGWRIEIKQHPRLTETGAWRKLENGSRYGGFYSQEDIKQIVTLAGAHNITVVPEIDLPGHSTAALAAYPQYSCTGKPLDVENCWGIFNNLLCPGKEETFRFIQDVLEEIIELFPGEYIHVGGDECPLDNWEHCPHCQSRIRRENLSGTKELFGYFMNRIALFLASKGKKLVGWDEIAEADLQVKSTIMIWRDPSLGVTAAETGHDVVMTPTSHCYFDYYQAQEGEPQAIGGYLPLEKVYEFEPVPANLPSPLSRQILGGQGNVWTEYMPDFQHVEYMTVPRLCAMAEVLWSPADRRNFNDFLIRLSTHYERLDQMKVNYRRHND